MERKEENNEERERERTRSVYLGVWLQGKGKFEKGESVFFDLIRTDWTVGETHSSK